MRSCGSRIVLWPARKLLIEMVAEADGFCKIGHRNDLEDGVLWPAQKILIEMVAEADDSCNIGHRNDENDEK